MLPAEILNVDPQADKPDGMYVCYVEPDNDIMFAEKELLLWSEGRWYCRPGTVKFRGHVYTCYGPLPGLKIEEFVE